MVRGLMSDKEWAFFKPFVTAQGPRRGRPAGNHRLVLDGVFWIARTGAPWRDLPDDFGKWSSVYRQFRRWSVSGLWDAMLEALNAAGFSAAPADALPAVRSAVDYVCRQKGGEGAVREVADLILAAHAKKT